MPNYLGQLPNQHQLVDHILSHNGISTTMARKPTLRAHAYSVQRLLLRLARSFHHELHRVPHPLFYLAHILHLGEFTRNYAKNHILVLWQMLQWLEAAGRGVSYSR
jgi:hypothetical protein